MSHLNQYSLCEFLKTSLGLRVFFVLCQNMALGWLANDLSKHIAQFLLLHNFVFEQNGHHFPSLTSFNDFSKNGSFASVFCFWLAFP